jgi:hypothetical protein
LLAATKPSHDFNKFSTPPTGISAAPSVIASDMIKVKLYKLIGYSIEYGDVDVLPAAEDV